MKLKNAGGWNTHYFHADCGKLTFDYFMICRLLQYIISQSKSILNSNIAKSRWNIIYFSIVTSVWNFAQSTVVSLPCYVQNDCIHGMGVLDERIFVRFVFKMSFKKISYMYIATNPLFTGIRISILPHPPPIPPSPPPPHPHHYPLIFLHPHPTLMASSYLWNICPSFCCRSSHSPQHTPGLWHTKSMAGLCLYSRCTPRLCRRRGTYTPQWALEKIELKLDKYIIFPFNIMRFNPYWADCWIWFKK